MKSYSSFRHPSVIGTETKTLYAEREGKGRKGTLLTHWHEEAECLTLLSGALEFQINEAVITLHAGDTLLLFPNVIHRNGREAEGTTLIRVLVNQEVMTADQEIRSRLIHPFFRQPPVRFSVHSCFSKRGRENIFPHGGHREGRTTQGSAGPPAVIAFLHLLLYRLCTLFPVEEKAIPLPSPSDRAVLKDMADFIRRHYGEKITLDEIAAAGKVSRSKCSSIFKTYMGSSPMDYVNEYRLSVSRTLLEYQDTPIADIAYTCGFSSQSYFAKLFSRTFHMTPRDFRAACRKAG